MSSLVCDVIPTPVGPCTVWMRGGKVCRVTISRDAQAPRRILPRARRWIEGFFAGRTQRVPLDLSGATPFQRRVYAAAMRIPRGRTVTYGQLARMAGLSRAARPVGQAMARNPICFFVP